MDFFFALRVSASGLAAERVRVNLASSNLANAESTRGPDGKPAGLPRFSMVAYTGGPMRIAGWRYPVVVDLAGLAIPNQNRPIRFGHDMQSGVGHTDAIQIDNGKLLAKGTVSRDTAALHAENSVRCLSTSAALISVAMSAGIAAMPTPVATAMRNGRRVTTAAATGVGRVSIGDDSPACHSMSPGSRASRCIDSFRSVMRIAIRLGSGSEALSRKSWCGTSLNWTAISVARFGSRLPIRR